VIGCVDLFCGLGGLTHGLARGGIRVVAGIDLDEQCRFPYEENNDAEFIHKGIQELSGKDLKQLWPKDCRTLLAGCAPCQPFSTYSRKGRQSRDDEKWVLVSDFGRLIRESKPDFVTMENVALRGFMSAPATYWDSTLSDKPMMSPVRLAVASAFRPAPEG